jgi:hypothetical protein
MKRRARKAAAALETAIAPALSSATSASRVDHQAPLPSTST